MSSGLRRDALGVGAITFFVVSAAGPLVAIAGGIPIAMLLGNGPGIPAMFLAATAILLIFAAGYTAMARSVRDTGAFYAFAKRGLGHRPAGAAGMVALLAYNAMQLGLYGLFGVAASGLLSPVLGADIPWYAYSFGALASIAFFGYRQVDLSAKVLGALVIGEYLVVLVLDGAILAAGGHEGLTARPFAWESITTGSPQIGLLFCFAAFVGFEATTLYSEEARNPQRTIPLATYLSLGVIGGFYIFSTWCVVIGAGTQQLLPTLTSLADPTTFLFGLSDRYAGGGVSTAMRILFVTSVYASLLAFHNAIARYLFALGRDGLLPASLARTHARHSSPHVASLAQTILVALALGLVVALDADPIAALFAYASALGTLGVVTLMTIASLAIVAYFRARDEGLWRTRILPVLATLLLASVTALACVRFEVLTGVSAKWVELLPLTIVLAIAVGAWMARVPRR